MRSIVLVLALLLTTTYASPAAGQRRGGGGGAVTFAVTVHDSTGKPLTDVKVILTGPASRSSRTEAGRIVFEGLPAGSYKFRFEKEGYDPVERTVAARGSTPIDVKVTLAKELPPITPVGSLPALPSAAKPVAIDMPAFIEKYYVGRAAGKTTPITCASGGGATLLQMNEPLAEHTHADSDEFLYFIAGQGAARFGERVEALGPGVFVMIPRGVAHVLTPAVKKPLVALSVRAGEKCAG